MIDLRHGDCLEIMKNIPDNSVHLLLTDIPYGKVNRKTSGLRNFDKGKADIVNFDLQEFLKEVTRIVSGSVYIFCGTEQVSSLRGGAVDLGMSTRIIVWEKTNPAPTNGQHLWLSGIELCVFGRFSKATFNGHCRNTVLRYPTERGIDHPTAKPLKMFEELVKISSNEGDTVLDCFMGSGTTGVACVKLKRNFIGIELDEKYFQLAKSRIEEATKEKELQIF